MSEIILRPYQQQAVEKLLWSQRLEGADICCLPTGAGKSIVIAEMARRMSAPVLILQPTKEILQQNMEKLLQYVEPVQVGVYSASMNRKDLGFYTFATIQSIYKKPEVFAHFKCVIIDECHLVNPKNLDGMFTSFLSDIGNPKVVGFTATPYRLGTMWITSERGLEAISTTKLINRIKERFWHRIVFNIDNEDLTKSGYLVPLRYIDKSVIQHEQIPLNISKSEFDLVAFQQKIAAKRDEVIDALFLAQELGKHVLVFCASVEQANELQGLMEGSEVVTANTPAKERDRIIRDFRLGKIQTVFNVGVLTMGFDHPALDCIVLIRPTRSIGLYYQMLGRGVRKCEGKKYCNVIDLTGTVKSIGRVHTIKMVKREKWELESEQGSWHNKPLYSFLVSGKEEKSKETMFLPE